ncbi:MAG: hypothetical protein HYV09_38170 [Deltaproteobacteria bacterium]|nr:hypothetical protein [Deltaproteobacteria bacterium]
MRSYVIHSAVSMVLATVLVTACSGPGENDKAPSADSGANPPSDGG